MGRKRALTLPFALEKNKLMEDPLRIPTSYLECGKIQQQIPWTAITGQKSKRGHAKFKNGAVLFDHNHAALVRRKPFLILTDVLKTEAGKAYMEKIKRHVNGKRKVSNLPNISRATQSDQKKTKSSKSRSKSLSPKSTQTPISSYYRSRSRSAKKAQPEEEKTIDNDNEIVSDKNEFELVDCGLSVTWKQEKNGNSSGSPINNTEQNKASKKRKLNETEPKPDETDIPKRPRANGLCLSGAADMEEEANDCPEKVEEAKDLNNSDGGILQFTVGEDYKAEKAVSPVSQDNAAATAITEPIVLSSDDEENNEKVIHKSFSRKQTTKKTIPPKKKLDPVQNLPAFPIIVNDHFNSDKGTCLCLAFTRLYCGPYHAMSNGDILITDENIIIPLKIADGEMDLMITLERRQLRGYSVLEKKELETLKYFSDKKTEIPAAGLLCCVSEDAAEGVQYDLIELCGKLEYPRIAETPSPYIFIFLQDTLEGMEGALLRSFLDMDCLNAFTEHIKADYNQQTPGPSMSLNESVELIKSSKLDPHLLRMLVRSTDSTNVKERQKIMPNCELDGDRKVNETSCEKSSQIEETEEPKTPIAPSEKESIQPVYTLCHRQMGDSYSITMCQPDSSWVRYKHHGLARRLIQFPPPPMKGGITVTMEDLQCLDIGQYLNDVIIDFYLKYLLQNASESVSRRSHIFSSFFYKQLTRRDNASESTNSESCQRQKRYQRVRTWTRHVDIFSKDFLFVPVNQEAHWYLVVICFPGLEEPKTEPFFQDQSEEKSSEIPHDDADNKAEKEDATDYSDSDTVNCTEMTCRRKTVSKRPCILVMDSLKRSPHERVSKLIREYLQSEWEARRGSLREFGPDQMQSSYCQVPLQENSSDCGLYLLHYVESFLKDPLVHFDLPLHLKLWFPRQQVRRKREEIRDLVLKLYRIQNMAVTT